MHILKKLILLSTLLFSIQSNSQVQVNVSIGSPPSWGPSGYSEVRYYYLPDVEAYYDVQTSMFIYFGDGIWVQRSYLPYRYRNYDLYSGYKVVLTDYHGSRPYSSFHDHCHRYAKGYRGKPQHNIGARPSNNHSNHRSPSSVSSPQKGSPIRMKSNENRHENKQFSAPQNKGKQEGGKHGGDHSGGGKHGGGKGKK